MSNEFNLEWAKRGGVVNTSVNEEPSFAKHLTTKPDGRVLFQFFVKNDESEQWHFGFIYPNDFHVLRMSTRAECEAAGVEYIEPPVDVEVLQKRIDELEKAIEATRMPFCRMLGYHFSDEHEQEDRVAFIDLQRELYSVSGIFGENNGSY